MSHAITLEEWLAFNRGQRARIGCMYLAITQHLAVIEALQPAPTIHLGAIARLETMLSAFLNGAAVPYSWTHDQCKAASTMDYRPLSAKFALHYFKAPATHRQYIMERAKEFLIAYLPGVMPMALLEGRV